jgi:hypothetical protein
MEKNRIRDKYLGSYCPELGNNFFTYLLVYLVLNFQWLRWGLSGSVFLALFSTSPS